MVGSQVPALLASRLTSQGVGTPVNLACELDIHCEVLDMTDQPNAQGPCALCHEPILETVDKTTIQGETYHAHCWDRKARSAAKK